MGLLDGYADSIERNALSAARRGMAEPAPEPSFSLSAATASIGKAVPAGLLEGFGAIRDFSNAIDKRHAEEVKAREKRLGLAPTEPYIMPSGRAQRKKADEFAPDPLTAHAAQQITFGFSKSLTKAGAAMALAGPTGGAAIFGLAEADDVAQRLQDKGIDSGTAWQVGGVVGALGAVGVRLPISGAALAATAGGKVAATAALGVAGGPVFYMAQEGAVREILQRAGHADEAKLHDPLNPIGLAASMFPLGIGAVSVRSAIKRMPATTTADVVMALESGGKRYGKDGALLTSPKGAQGEMQVMPGTATDPGFGVAPARDAGPDELARVGRDYLAAMEARYGNTDQAMAAYNAGPGAVDAAIKKGGADWLKNLPTETQNYVAKGRKALDDNVTLQVRANPDAVDAARVTVLDQTVARSLPDHPMAHSEMLRAADMVGAGERVEVQHMIGPAERANNFAAWAQEAPLIPAMSGHTFKTGEPIVADAFHGTARDFDSFSNQTLGEKTGGPDARGGHFLSDNPGAADQFTWENGDKSGHIMPAYVRLLNPLVSDHFLNGSTGTAAGKIIEEAKRAGHDGVIFPRSDMLGNKGATFVAFDPKQIKSAIGNSGRFDPASASLTDPLPQRPNATNPAQAANLEAAAPARGAGEAPGAGAADAGRSASDVQAAGIAERQASAEQQAVQALAEQYPDMPVRLPGDEKTTTLAAALERIRDEQAHAAQEGDLYRVAVQCALTAGAATP